MSTPEVEITPSAGVEPNAAPAAPSPSAEPAAAPSGVDYSKMDDAAILDSPASPETAQPEAAPAEPAAAEPGQGETPTEKPAEAKPAEEALAEDGRVMPHKWRELSKSDPDFRALFYRDRANTDKLTTLEAQLPELQQAKADLDASDAAFFSGDPAQQEQYLSTLAQQDVAACESASRVMDKVLAKANPEAFKALSQERLLEGLKGQSFEPFIASLLEAKQLAADGDRTALDALTDELIKWGQGLGFAATKEQMLARQERELKERETTLKTTETQAQERRVASFHKEGQRRVEEGLNTQVKEVLGRVLKGSAFQEGAQSRIAKEIVSEVTKLWAQNPELKQQIQAALYPRGDGKPDIAEATQARMVEAISKFNKTVLDGIAKKVIEEFTKDFLAAQGARSEKIATAASRQDITGAGPQEHAKKLPTPREIDYSKTSDEQLLSL